MIPRDRTVISLYTGIGGLDFGFEAAGYRTAVAVEMDPVACDTVRLNRPDWPLFEADIHDVSSGALLQAAGLEPGEPDVLIGGPPCQPFSKSSYWTTGSTLRLDDPRADTLTAYLRVLRDTQPKAFLLENVYGLVYKGKDEGLRHLLEGISQINRETGTRYTISWRMLNASHYGVPQGRERVFLVGFDNGKPFSFPSATHGHSSESSLFQDCEPSRCAWDALGDLPQDVDDPSLRVGGKWGDLLPTIPEGQNYLWHTRRRGGEPLFGWRTRYWSFLLKLAKDRPSWTIQAQPGPAVGPLHWNNRKLTVQEMCRLQTFPDGLQFACGRGDAQKMLGNAVPSLLAEVLARAIREQRFDEQGALTDLRLLPPMRRPIPPAEPIQPLPDKYLKYIGDHPDHPGEGRKSAAIG